MKYNPLRFLRTTLAFPRQPSRVISSTAFALCLLAIPAHAQTFSITGLSTQDLLVIGSGLDKLPREDTDRNNLYQRIQAQITQQSQAAAKAKADADKAALDKAVTDALKAKSETKTEGSGQ